MCDHRQILLCKRQAARNRPPSRLWQADIFSGARPSPDFAFDRNLSPHPDLAPQIYSSIPSEKSAPYCITDSNIYFIGDDRILVDIQGFFAPRSPPTLHFLRHCQPGSVRLITLALPRQIPGIFTYDISWGILSSPNICYERIGCRRQTHHVNVQPAYLNRAPPGPPVLLPGELLPASSGTDHFCALPPSSPTA